MKIVKLSVMAIMFGALLSFMAYALGWFSEGAQVVQEEFGPSAALEKYEWFKNASETIEQKKRTIGVYETNINEINASYDGIPRKDWDRIDKQQYNQWRAEITGMKASYNKVVKDYNSQSSKFNWEMFNTSGLPRSYDLYLSD
jgi:hypothetical protein